MMNQREFPQPAHEKLFQNHFWLIFLKGFLDSDALGAFDYVQSVSYVTLFEKLLIRWRKLTMNWAHVRILGGNLDWKHEMAIDDVTHSLSQYEINMILCTNCAFSQSNRHSTFPIPTTLEFDQKLSRERGKLWRKNLWWKCDLTLTLEQKIKSQKMSSHEVEGSFENFS